MLFSRSVKHIKRTLIILPLLLVLLLAAVILAFNSGLFHSRIESEAQAALGPGAKVHLGEMKLMYRWPPLVRIGPSVLEMNAANIDWQNLEAEFPRVASPYAVSLNLHRLQMTLKPAAGAPPQEKPATPAARGGPAKSLPLSVKLQIVDGEIKTEYGGLTKLNLKFEQKLLMKTPASLHMSALARAKAFPVELPLQLDTDKLTFSQEMVKTSDLKASLGGLNASVQGTSLLTEGRHRWLLEVLAKDLAQLPQPPMAQVPAKKWRGEINLKAEVAKESASAGWAAEGQILARGVGAEVDFKQGQTLVHGPFALEAEGKFSFSEDRARVPNFKAALDLSAAEVNYADLLTKPAGIPMKVSVQAGGDPQKLAIQELNFDFWHFAGRVVGAVELKAPFQGDLSMTLKPASLNGSEKIFPPLKASPVQGEVAVSGSVRGPLADPMKSHFRLESLVLKKFSGVVNFEREGFAKIRGPVTADVQGKGEFINGAVKSAEGRGQADLSPAALVLGPLRKEEKSAFRLRFAVRNSGTSILIDEIELASFVGNLGLKGKVDVQTAPKLDMVLNAKPVSLSELRIAMPAMREMIPKGTLVSELKISGALEMAKPWHDWPLKTSGRVEVKIPEYKMAVAAPQDPKAESTGKGGAAAESSAFLPDGELTRSARLNIKAQVDQFVKEPLVAKGISADGLYAGGKFTGTVNVSQIFGGSVQIKNLNVPMLQAKPRISGSANWLNLVIEDAIGFAKPEYKTFASGKTAGLADFSTLMPGEPAFLAQLKARGDVVANPVVFNSVKIGEMVNAQTAKIPQLKLKPMKVDPLRGQAKAQFDLNNGVAEIANFQGSDLDGSEIQLKGKLVLTSMEGDFAGRFYWADPPVKGCALEGNADSSGRMIVPLAIKGNLMQPGLSLLSDVLGKLAGKALECEGKKLLEKAKADGQQSIEKELKKTLKNLLGN